MHGSMYQLIGRRLDRPQSLLLRDSNDRHFIRPECGARPVRISARDAARLIRHRTYHPVVDTAWLSEDEVAAMQCTVPLPADISAGFDQIIG